jgi:hypothetical protein
MVVQNRTAARPTRRMKVLQGFAELREAMADWPSDRLQSSDDARNMPDARNAPTLELRAQAVAYHEARLAELAQAYAAQDATQANTRQPTSWLQETTP